MSLSDPVILTNSISGAVANRDQCPAIPYTPAEYAAEARRAVEEGAAMIHIHARTPDGTPSYEVEDFRAITEAIVGAVDDVIVTTRPAPSACRSRSASPTCASCAPTSPRWTWAR